MNDRPQHKKQWIPKLQVVIEPEQARKLSEFLDARGFKTTVFRNIVEEVLRKLEENESRALSKFLTGQFKIEFEGD